MAHAGDTSYSQRSTTSLLPLFLSFFYVNTLLSLLYYHYVLGMELWHRHTHTHLTGCMGIFKDVSGDQITKKMNFLWHTHNVMLLSMKSNVCIGFLSGWFVFSSFCALMFSKCSTLNINVFYREERHFWSTLSLLCLRKATIQRAVLWLCPSLYPKAEGMQLFGMSPTANANYHRNWAQKQTNKQTPEPSFPVSYVPVHQCLQG